MFILYGLDGWRIGIESAQYETGEAFFQDNVGGKKGGGGLWSSVRRTRAVFVARALRRIVSPIETFVRIGL